MGLYKSAKCRQAICCLLIKSYCYSRGRGLSCSLMLTGVRQPASGTQTTRHPLHVYDAVHLLSSAWRDAGNNAE